MRKLSTLRAVVVPLLSAFFIAASVSAFAQPCHLVISQIYGAGGNTGANWQNDFIEIFNPTGSTQSLTGWSVQYASSAGTSWSVTSLTGSIAPGKYYLVKQAGGANGSVLPTADATGTIAMSGTAGKVALVSSTTALSGGCPTGGSIVDFVGFGAAANCFEGAGPTGTLAVTTAAVRGGSGCTDTDGNSADFSVTTAAPRNSATAANYCTPTQLVITSISPASPTANAAFDVTVEARNANNVAQNVTAATLVTLTTNGNGGAIGGVTSNTIANGTNSIVISGVTLASAGTGVTLTATRTSGQTCLTAGTSASFTVQAGTATSVQFVSTSSSIAENAGSTNLALAITNFDAANATSVTITAAGATGRISTFTTPVTFPANNGSNQNCTVNLNDDLLCNGSQNVVFTITGISGGQGTPTIGSNSAHTLTVNNDDLCTNVSFATTSASVSEGVGTYNVTVNITDPSGSQATNVDVALLSGNAARINGFSSQSISFPAGSSTPINVTITVSDNGDCSDGDELLT
ncbi:MAG TPA: lamin tail domain-containing protein, partial [Flavobacteriales bacterium]|nr:lamin tail domain-containing protein [Flavobacteriales bacterium]